MNHTPTPFEVKYIGRNVYIEPQGRKGFIADLQYTDCQSEEEMGEALANAQFIVRACNAHEELVDVLETCLAYVDCGSSRSESDMVEQSIRKALAKAKEVPQ